MSLSQNITSMNDAWVSLERKFASTHDEWNDKVREQFDRDYWSNLHETMPSYFQALDDLNRTFQQARQNIR